MDVRSRILEAALGLLAESGAHELTQPRVARAAGVRQSHLTYYFPTRAALMQAVARHSIERLAGDLARRQGRRATRVARAAEKLRNDPRMPGLMLAPCIRWSKRRTCSSDTAKARHSATTSKSACRSSC